MITAMRRVSSYFHKFVRACYDWMIAMASNEHAMYFLAAIAFIESSFFPIPPDIMLIPMVLAAPQKAWRIAGVATAASVVGGYFGYAIGVFGYEVIAKPILNFYGYMQQFETFQGYYHEWGAWIVFGAGVTPFLIRLSRLPAVSFIWICWFSALLRSFLAAFAFIWWPGF